jgi:hypothetical protein
MNTVDWPMVAAVLCVVTFMFLCNAAERLRIAGRRKAVQDLKEVRFRTDLAARKDAFKRLGLLDYLDRGGKGVTWCAGALLTERQVDLLEHVTHVFRGASLIWTLPLWNLRRRTIARVEIPHDWPPLVVSSERQACLIDTTSRRSQMRLDNESFNSKWRVQAHDENFATVFLTPKVQEWCMGLPASSILHVGLGALCISTTQHVVDLKRFASLPTELLDTLCDELKVELRGSAMSAAAV